MVNEVLRTDIPDDWDVITLGDYAQIFRGGSPRPIQAFLTTSDQGINWIKIGDVGVGDKFIESTEEKIIPEGVLRSRMVYEGDLILSNSMSYGRPYIMNIEGCIHDGWLVIQKYDKVFNRDYLYYALSSDLTMRQYAAMAAGSSVQNLNKEKVSKVVLPCPKIPEQEQIAKALSCTDGLIMDLKKLVRKKKEIRQGTMQMLVTGKRRLDGFAGEWFDCTLDAIAYVLNGDRGINYPSGDDFIDYGIPFINAGNIIDNVIDISTADYISIEKYNSLGGAKIQKNDIIFCLRGSLGKCAISDFTGGAPASSLCVIRAKDGIDARFLFHIINSEITSRQIDNLNAGSSQPNLSAKSLKSFKFIIPKDVAEQEMISNILSNMDSDIRKLEEKLSKYQKVKQGMMEELLTGKIRLV